MSYACWNIPFLWIKVEWYKIDFFGWNNRQCEVWMSENSMEDYQELSICQITFFLFKNKSSCLISISWKSKNDIDNINLMFISLPYWNWCVLKRANDNEYGYNCHIKIFHFIYKFVYFFGFCIKEKIEGIWHFPSFNYVCMSNKWFKVMTFLKI